MTQPYTEPEPPVVDDPEEEPESDPENEDEED